METQLQLFHHDSIIDGTWTSLSHLIVAVSGVVHTAKSIWINQKSGKDVKFKHYSISEFATSVENAEFFLRMASAKTKFSHKNIILNPALIIKTFIGIQDTTPHSVA